MSKFDLKKWFATVTKWTYGDAVNAAPLGATPESLIPPPIAAEAATDAPAAHAHVVPAWTLDVKERCDCSQCQFNRLARRMYAVHPN